MYLGHGSLAILAAHALGTSLLLTAAPAHAAPVFTDAETFLDPYSDASSFTRPGGSGTCDHTSTGGAEPNVPVTENGGPGSASSSATSTFTSTAVPGDTAIGAVSASGTAEVASAGGNLSTIDLSVTSHAQLVNALGTSANCFRSVYGGIELEFELTVTQPGFLGLRTTDTGSGYGQFAFYRYLPGSQEDATVSSSGEGLKFNAVTRVFLPTGTYRGVFQGGISKYSLSSYTISATTTVHGEFHAAGSQTTAVSGKGKKYVTLPGTRSCATQALAPSITGKKSRAGQVRQVTFLVNDKRVKKVRTPDRGDAIQVPVADDQAADIVAKVQLFSKRKGKPGKVVEVSASYEACS